MKVIYISGKYRDARGIYYVLENIRAAEEAALEVWAAGGVAICPHKNTAGFDGAFNLSEHTWLNGDLELVRRCDAIYMLPNWVDSEGAAKERAEAERIGLPVLYDLPAVTQFIYQDVHVYSFNGKASRIRADYLERMAAAFLLSTGAQPEEVTLVEKHDANKITWHYERKS